MNTLLNCDRDYDHPDPNQDDEKDFDEQEGN